jgi:hypothetical protein
VVAVTVRDQTGEVGPTVHDIAIDPGAGLERSTKSLHLWRDFRGAGTDSNPDLRFRRDGRAWRWWLARAQTVRRSVWVKFLPLNNRGRLASEAVA